MDMDPKSIVLSTYPHVLKTPVQPIFPGIYVVLYKPTVGKLLISISVLGEPVLTEHPVIWKRPLKNIFPDPLKSIVTGPVPENPLTGVPSEFTLTTFYPNGKKCPEGGELVEVVIQPPSGLAGLDLSPSVKDHGDGTYSISIPPLPFPGDYPVSITLDEDVVKGSPFLVQVLPFDNITEHPLVSEPTLDSASSHGPDPSKSVLSGSALEGATRDIPTELLLTTHLPSGERNQKGGDRVDVNIHGPKGVTVSPAKINDLHDGTYEIDFKLPEEGSYQVNVSLNERPVSGSPVTVVVEDILSPVITQHVHAAPIEVEGHPDPACTVVSGPLLEKPPFIGIPTELHLATFHPNGTPCHQGGTPLEVSVNGPVSVVPAVTDNEDGTYSVVFPIPDSPFTVEASLDGVPVPGSPFSIHPIHPGNAGDYHLADLIPRYRCHHPTSFTILPIKKNGGQPGQPFEVKATGCSGLNFPTKILDNQDGHYAVEFSPVEVGEMKAQVTLAGKPVLGSPFTAFVVPGDSVKTLVTGQGLFGGPVLIPLLFIVHAHVTNDKNKNLLPVPLNGVEVVITPVSGGNRIIPTITEVKPGVFDITYVLPTPGDYRIVVLVLGESVSAEPFMAKGTTKALPHPSSKGSPYRCHVTGIPSHGKVPLGPLEFTVSVVDDQDRPTEVSSDAFEVRPSSYISVKVQPVPKKPGTFLTTVIPTGPQAVTLDFLVYGLSGIPQPIPLTFGDVPVGTTFIRSVPTSVPVFCPVTFDIVLEDPNHSPEVVVVDSDGNNVPAVIQDDGKGLVHTVFLPKSPSTYNVDVQVQGRPVSGSPFTVRVFSVRALLTGTDMSRPFLCGLPVAFYIEVQDDNKHGVVVPPGALTLHVAGTARPKTKVKPSPSDPSHPIYPADFTLLRSGEYHLDVLLFGEPILENGPLRIRSVVPVFRRVTLDRPMIFYVDRPVVFSFPLVTIDGSHLELRPEDLQVSVEGPVGSVPGKVVSIRPDGTTEVVFKPTSVGPYTIMPMMEGSPLLETSLPALVVGAVHPPSCEIVDFPEEILEKQLPVKFKIIAKDNNGNLIPIGGVPFAVEAVPIIPETVTLSPHPSPVSGTVVDHGDGTYSVTLAPTLPCDYNVTPVLLPDRQPVGPFSPIHLRVVAPSSPRHCVMELVTRVTVRARVIVFINKTLRKLTGGDRVAITVQGSDGKVVDNVVTDNDDGTYTVAWEHQRGPGEYVVSATVDGEPVENSPMRYRVAE